MVMRLPEGDRYSTAKAKLHDDLAVAMGGRVAEELIFGDDKVTTGASSDIKMATDMARRMVTEWGMSARLGPLNYSESQEGYLGYGGSQPKPISDATAQIVDEEVRKIVEAAYARARQILTEKSHDLEALAQALLEYETLSGEEITDLRAGRGIHRTEDSIKPLKRQKAAGRASVPVSE
ncbi:MAG: cell division protein FtsH, partial [Holosporales bacterium]